MFNALPARGLAAALIGLVAGLSLPAQAQVHKCTQADGSVTFQSAPCGSDAPAREERVTAAQLNAAQRAQERARARAAAASNAASANAHAAAASKPRPCASVPASSPKGAKAAGRSNAPSKPC